MVRLGVLIVLMVVVRGCRGLETIVDIERGYERMGEVMIGLVMLCKDGY